MIAYRKANRGDIDEICRLVENAKDTLIRNGIFQWDDIYPAKEDFLDDIYKKRLYVGLEGESIAVLYTLNRECDEEYKNGNWKYKDEPFYVVHRLCVNPVFQNRGIAKSALLHIENELKAINIHAVRLDVFSENPFALSLYGSLGYSIVGHADWRKGKFYLMEKYF